MAEEEVAVVAPVEVTENETSSVTTDLKRKLEDIEPEEADAKSSIPDVDLPKEELIKNSSDDAQNSAPDAKKPRLTEEESDGSVLENGLIVQKSDVTAVENNGTSTAVNVDTEDVENASSKDVNAENLQSADSVDAGDVTVVNAQLDNAENQSAEIPQEEDAQKASGEILKTEDAQHPSEEQHQSASENQSTSRKMQVPNNKVGVLIGKAGDTIRFLQLNSGAKIQITRDAEAVPYSTTRSVELIGTLENINKAEKLIKDVIAEAEAGGSPSLVARGFGTVQATGVAEQIQISVPNEKVGLIIGKGGESIKQMQTRSGARIQLLPQHLSEGDTKERTVRVTGDKKQIEMAKDLINEAMSQPVKPSSLSGGGHSQHGYRPRGPPSQSQWGGRAPPSGQGAGYDNHQRGGMYSSQNQYNNRPPYGGYPSQQPGPRSNFNSGWGDQRHGPRHPPPSQGGYNDYYGRGADSSGPAPMTNSGPIPPTGHGPPPTHVNYNYGQTQGPDSYGQPAPYSQPVPSQQNYGHGYDDQKYANQVPAQPGFGNVQPGGYQQPQVAPQSGYVQQPYSKPPTYGASQSYGPPRADVPYQNPAAAYGQTAPTQQQSYQQYPTPAPQSYPQGYTSAPPANDGYSQAPTHSAPASVYPQQGGVPPQSGPAGYGHPGPQAAPVYAQGGQPGAYGAYPTQPGYAEQSVPANAGYGYQAPDPNYGGAPVAAYGGAPAAQPNYVQPAPTYEQQQQQQAVPQAGAYASVPPTQMYAGQH